MSSESAPEPAVPKPSVVVRPLIVSATLAAAAAGPAAGQTQSDFGGVRTAEPPAETRAFDPDAWSLVWADEFDVDGPPNPEHWGYELGLIRNRELQLYTDRPENARVEDGVLVIEAIREEVSNPGYDPDAPEEQWQASWKTVPHTSAGLNTRGKHDMTYGRIAARAKLPEGRGMWPAIWMLASDIDVGGGRAADGSPGVPWPRCGEIDIMEYVGHEPGVAHTAVHTGVRNHMVGNHPTGRISPGDLHDTFRTYAVEWDADKIEFFVDDTLVQTYVNDSDTHADPEGVWPFDKPHYLIMNIAVGGAWGGQQGVDESIFPQRMEVDWVRVWERK